MKKLISYFKTRREIELRKFCIEASSKSSAGCNVKVADQVYNYIIKGELPE